MSDFKLNLPGREPREVQLFNQKKIKYNKTVLKLSYLSLMDGAKTLIKKVILIILLSITLIGIIYSWHEYEAFISPPKSRLAQGSSYPEMPADEHHIYLQLPVDHHDPTLGTFTDFYLLSPNFKPGGNVVFILFDNQQEAVGMVKTAEDF